MADVFVGVLIGDIIRGSGPTDSPTWGITGDSYRQIWSARNTRPELSPAPLIWNFVGLAFGEPEDGGDPDPPGTLSITPGTTTTVDAGTDLDPRSGVTRTGQVRVELKNVVGSPDINGRHLANYTGPQTMEVLVDSTGGSYSGGTLLVPQLDAYDSGLNSTTDRAYGGDFKAGVYGTSPVFGAEAGLLDLMQLHYGAVGESERGSADPIGTARAFTLLKFATEEEALRARSQNRFLDRWMPEFGEVYTEFLVALRGMCQWIIDGGDTPVPVMVATGIAYNTMARADEAGFTQSPAFSIDSIVANGPDTRVTVVPIQDNELVAPLPGASYRIAEIEGVAGHVPDVNGLHEVRIVSDWVFDIPGLITTTPGTGGTVILRDPLYLFDRDLRDLTAQIRTDMADACGLDGQDPAVTDAIAAVHQLPSVKTDADLDYANVGTGYREVEKIEARKRTIAAASLNGSVTIDPDRLDHSVGGVNYSFDGNIQFGQMFHDGWQRAQRKIANRQAGLDFDGGRGIIVYGVIGDSRGVGTNLGITYAQLRSQLYSGTTVGTDRDFKIWHHTQGEPVDYESTTLVANTNGRWNQNDADKVGPEVSLGLELTDVHAGQPILLAKLCASGSTLVSGGVVGAWNRSEGTLFRDFGLTLTEIVQYYADLGMTVDYRGTFVFCGYNDAAIGTHGAFATELDQFIGDLRREVTTRMDKPYSPIIWMEEPEHENLDRPNGVFTPDLPARIQTINAAIRSAASRDVQFVSVDTSENDAADCLAALISSDNVHYSLQGNVNVGIRMVNGRKTLTEDCAGTYIDGGSAALPV